jgi:tetratricopeptide (TPR) repeat protein
MRRKLTICLLLILTTCVVYWQVLEHDFVNFDDTIYIISNRHVQEGFTADSITWAFTQKDTSYWHPLTWLSLMANYEIHGLSPSGFHATNLALHVMGSALLFLTLSRMTGSLWRSGFVAALFALHPLNVESVAWAVERKNVLSTFFWMLTLLTYGRYAERSNLSRYLLTLLCFTLGLMAKPMLVTLPCVLLLLDYWPLGRFHLQQSRRDFEEPPPALIQPTAHKFPVHRLVLEKIPFFSLSAVSIFLCLWSAQQPGFVVNIETRPISLRIANGLVSYVSYIGKMIWPHDLAVFYPHPDTVPWPQVAAAALFLVIVSLLALRLVRLRPYIFVGWFWYLGTLVPVIGLVQAGLWPAMADRFVYLPLIGLFIVITWGVTDLSVQSRYRLAIMSAAAGIVLSALTIRTWTQLHHWKNSEALLEHTLKVTSRNYLAHNNLGAALDERGKIAEAMYHYTEALKINPHYWPAENNLATALAKKGKIREATEHYQKALKLKPYDAGIHNNFGTSLVRQGKIDEAVSHFLEALEVRPDFAEVYSNLGNVYKEQGQLDEAFSYYSKALEIKPDQAEAHNNLGILLANQGRFKEAISHYAEALRLHPESAETHNNLAVALVELGELEAAISHYGKAIDLQPNYAEAYNNLGNALSEQGKLNEAVATFSRALEIRPNSPQAYNNLGVAMARQGRLAEAIAHFKEALRLKPDYVEARANLELVLQMMGQGVTGSHHQRKSVESEF